MIDNTHGSPTWTNFTTVMKYFDTSNCCFCYIHYVIKNRLPNTRQVITRDNGFLNYLSITVITKYFNISLMAGTNGKL